MSERRRAVFLDRDGVLNRALVRDGLPYSPASLTEMELLLEASSACAALREAGFLLILVTNQPDIARGTQTLDRVNEINNWLQRKLHLDDVCLCAHDDSAQCSCRKPLPGLLTNAAARWSLDLAECFMVGDRWRDVEAGQRAGCRTVFIDRQYREKRPADPDYTAHDLSSAADWITWAAAKRMNQLDPKLPLRIKIFADGAALQPMLDLARQPWIQGFTTNPTLMRQAGVSDYEAFAREVIANIPDRPVSFEVFSDELDQMELQALKIAGWGENVYVKVPVTNTQGESTGPILRSLSECGVKLNVTALMTLAQVESTAKCLAASPGGFVSVFAGRIADTGKDPVPIMSAAVEVLRAYPNLELIWASPRELLNIVQADAIGCQVITVTPELLKKLPLIGKNLEAFSLDTVKMFYQDACSAGYTLADCSPSTDLLNLSRALQAETIQDVRVSQV